MSQQNVELVAAGVRAYNDGDLGGLLATLDPDAELVPVRSLLEGGSYRGHDAVRRWLAEMGEEWSRFEIHPDAYRDTGDRVLLLAHFHVRGRASGVEVSTPAAWVFDCRDGKITGMHAYSDPDEAQRALESAE